jgi:hypothetical protein
LKILREAVIHWETRANRELIAVFHRDIQEDVQRLLRVMSETAIPFYFSKDPDRYYPSAYRLIFIPHHHTEENWDSLRECLLDLSWIDDHRVILWQWELPRLGEERRQRHLQILAEAVLHWQAPEDHELMVILPPEAQAVVQRLVPERGSR